MTVDRAPHLRNDNNLAGREHENADEHGPAGVYAERCARFEERRLRIDRRWHRVANARLALFLIGSLILGLGIWFKETMFLVAAIPCAVGFVAAVAYHTRLGEARRVAADLWAINDEGLRRLRRDWSVLPLPAVPAEAHEDAVATDLDLFGRASLQHLLHTPATAVGQTTLRHWLLHPVATPAVRERQSAVVELAQQIEFRDALALRARVMGEAQGDYQRFAEWAENPEWLTPRRHLVWAARLIPAATAFAFIAQLNGLVTYPVWLLGLLVSYGMILTAGKQVDAEIEQVAERQVVFRAYAALFALIGGQPFAAPFLQRLQQQLSAAHLPADRQMARLGRIMILADLRLWLLYFPVKLLTLWNFHVLWLLERWKRAAGGEVRAWLEALGEAEALAALATLTHDHPHWTFPELVDGKQPVLVAANLGHPLLPPETCVGNDVTVGPPGSFLLVTGSNMSGKSTLLRAIGLNVVLAQAGGPVCGSAMCLPPLVLATSMRVQDSLELGVSYFMAELRRLRHVVEAANEAHAHGERTALFLLDEILHGTNTHERQVAVRRIVRHLTNVGAIGAISTHDLSLASTPEVAAAGRPVYFTEQFVQGTEGLEMRFDYVLRPGIAPSTNALKLMELVGLALDGSEDVAAVGQDAAGSDGAPAQQRARISRGGRVSAR